MTQIDELALLLLVQANPDAGELLWRDGPEDVRATYRAHAAEIIAAGYRRTRPVSTVDELAALPVGSVVMTRQLGGLYLWGISVVATRGVPAEEFYGYPWTIDGHPGHYSHEGLVEFIGTQLEVLFEPDQEDATDA